MTETAIKEAVTLQVQEAPPTNLPAIAQDRPARVVKPEPKQYPARIAKSILAISRDIGQIQKKGINEFQRYKYTRWEDINEALSPLLAEHGLIIVQNEQSRNLLEENDKGSVLAIIYHFTIVNEHGESWPETEWTAIARLRDQKGVTDDKAAAKCHTQAEKGYLLKQFKIRTGEFIDSEDRAPTLPKKDARDIYSKLQAEIDGSASLVELQTWGKSNYERIQTLPVDWQEILRGRYAEKLGDLKNNTAVEIWDDDHDSETGEVKQKP